MTDKLQQIIRERHSLKWIPTNIKMTAMSVGFMLLVG
jgi:hypothetical protein